MSYSSDAILSGVNHIWNGDAAAADAALEATKDTDARASLHYAENYWLLALICDVRDHQKVATERLSAAKKQAEQYKKQASKHKGSGQEKLNAHLDSLVVYGEACMLSAFHQMTSTQDFTKAVVNLKAAWGAFQDAEKIVPPADAQVQPDPALLLLLHFDLGMFLWFLSLLPEFLGPAAKLLALIGFKGDNERGIAYLEEVAASTSARSAFANIILVVRHLYLPMRAFPYDRAADDDVTKGLSLLDGLNERWPTSLAAMLVRGIAYRRLARFDEAKDVLQAMASALAAQNIETMIATTQLGHVFSNQCLWAEAIECYAASASMKTYIRPYTPLFYQGICEVQAGRVPEGHKMVADANSMAKKQDDGEFRAQIEKYLNNAFLAPFELMWTRGELLFGAQQEAVMAALEAHVTLLGVNSTDRGDTPTTKRYKHSSKDKASHALTINATKGMLYRLAGDNEEALKYFGKIVKLTPHGKAEKNAFWQMHFEAADIYYEDGKKEEAHQLLKKTSTSAHTSRMRRSARAALPLFA